MGWGEELRHYNLRGGLQYSLGGTECTSIFLDAAAGIF